MNDEQAVEINLDTIAELEAWDHAFGRWYEPDKERPDLGLLRVKIRNRLYQWMPQLLDAAKQVLLRDAFPTVEGWRPIETAPKDGTRILLWFPELLNNIGVVVGQWELDEYRKKSCPYWTCDLHRVAGTMLMRGHQPTHWMPLPVPPIAVVQVPPVQPVPVVDASVEGGAGK